MAVLPVVLWPDVRLQTVCDPVPNPSDHAALIQDMFDTMYAAPGRGLAAPQVGVMSRMFVMDPTWKEGTYSPYACFNPEIIKRSEAMTTGQEACLSIPGVAADVVRHAEITMRWQDVVGASHEEHLTGFAAICAQHEFDHLNGTVIFDHQAPEMRALLEMGYRRDT
ncbi:peptide deformylase [Cochlodiniinecator piscidefendens]|uniref:peptide deformylase n=1 Tax=Cochlodiniinecator piscidefendens TaxID=2715756 RepID=UPI00140E2826|nr:peptide deformylase [Cochlodiniinecator piscidefendens]